MLDESDHQDLDDRLLARMLEDFLEEAAGHLDQLNLNLIQLEQGPEDEALIEEIFRVVHTLKGSAAFVGLREISEVSRKMEEVFGAVRQGAFNVTASMIPVLYDALDTLTTLLEKAAGGDSAEVDTTPIVQSLEKILTHTTSESAQESEPHDTGSADSRDILNTYKASYDQLAALKHIVYSSIHLFEPESLAVLFSKQIDERMGAERNAVWLVGGDQKVVEVACDGNAVGEDKRRLLDIESSTVLKRVIREQIVVWPSCLPQVKDLLPEFQSPTLFPIKGQPQALGFLVVDPEESAEVEVYQFVGQFAAMILNISKLHQKVEEQREELNEMTEILFKQNAHLSSIHHVELEMMKVSDPVDLCRLLVKAAVDELGAHRAFAFLLDEPAGELIGASEGGESGGKDAKRLPIDREKPIQQAIESGRVVTFRDYPEALHLGSERLENWVVMCLKGRGGPRGVLVAELGDEDVADAISILANYGGILMDNLMLQGGVRGATKGARGNAYDPDR